MTEVTAEAAHDAKLQPDSSSDRDKWDSGKDVGRYAASLTEIENEAVEPKVPADMVSIIDKLHKILGIEFRLTQRKRLTSCCGR